MATLRWQCGAPHVRANVSRRAGRPSLLLLIAPRCVGAAANPTSSSITQLHSCNCKPAIRSSSILDGPVTIIVVDLTSTSIQLPPYRSGAFQATGFTPQIRHLKGFTLQYSPKNKKKTSQLDEPIHHFSGQNNLMIRYCHGATGKTSVATAPALTLPQKARSRRPPPEPVPALMLQTAPAQVLA
jgi:hypothetical protein